MDTVPALDKSSDAFVNARPVIGNFDKSDTL